MHKYECRVVHGLEYFTKLINELNDLQLAIAALRLRYATLENLKMLDVYKRQSEY